MQQCIFRTVQCISRCSPWDSFWLGNHGASKPLTTLGSLNVSLACALFAPSTPLPGAGAAFARAASWASTPPVLPGQEGRRLRLLPAQLQDQERTVCPSGGTRFSRRDRRHPARGQNNWGLCVLLLKFKYHWANVKTRAVLIRQRQRLDLWLD